MHADPDSYDDYLDTWSPSPHLLQACLPPNIGDPYALDRLHRDVEAVGDVPRETKVPGTHNRMTEPEEQIRKLQFLQSSQAGWASDFRERMLGRGVRADRLDSFIDAMANTWILGKSTRQQSDVMLRIKSSIQAHDRFYHRQTAGKFVKDDGDFGVEPLFDARETEALFQTNSDILMYAISNYVDAVYGEASGSTDDVFVRRGICMPHDPEPSRMEVSYLSSFSLASGTTELFAQTMGSRICTQIPCIISCPVMAIHDRIVAFAPFIKGMPLDQMEFVLAPPVVDTPLNFHGEFSGVREYSFG